MGELGLGGLAAGGDVFGGPAFCWCVVFQGFAGDGYFVDFVCAVY